MFSKNITFFCVKNTVGKEIKVTVYTLCKHSHTRTRALRFARMIHYLTIHKVYSFTQFNLILIYIFQIQTYEISIKCFTQFNDKRSNT